MPEGSCGLWLIVVVFIMRLIMAGTYLIPVLLYMLSMNKIISTIRMIVVVSIMINGGYDILQGEEMSQEGEKDNIVMDKIHYQV